MKAISFLLITCITIGACQTKNQETNTPSTADSLIELTEAQLKNSDIKTGTLEKRRLSSLLKVNGIIDVPPQNMVSISVPLGGYLKSTKLLPGLHINKGEIIAVIEDQQYITLQQDYLTAQAKLLYAEAEFLRQEELNKSKAASDKVYQLAKMEFTTQNILKKSLSEKLKLIGINPETLTENNLSRSINITSPIDGYVSKVNVNIGKYANPSDILFELVNPTDIHLALTVFEKDIDKLFIGQKLVTYTNSNPEKKYSCEIILIGKDLTKDRSVEVHCHFNQYDKTLIPGMFMNAELEVESKSGFVIPSEAIVRFEEKQYVFTQAENKKYRMEEVITLNTENGFTQIAFIDTVDMNNKPFVIKGAYTLLMKKENTADE